jgi:hypothetical protein
MEFDITLTAKTTDDGGLAGSFTKQLSDLGGTATVLETGEPYRVDSSNGSYFESKNTYHVVTS